MGENFNIEKFFLVRFIDKFAQMMVDIRNFAYDVIPLISCANTIV